MKLYNRTDCPDDVLAPMLKRAARAIGARHGKVVVIVTQNRSKRITGECLACAWVRASRPGWRGPKIATDGGYMHLRLPEAGPDDPVRTAERLWEVMLHEWGHIRDFQHGGSWSMAWSRKGSSGRRPRWADRPEEIRANAMCHDALREDDGGDDMLAYALWYEEPSQ